MTARGVLIFLILLLYSGSAFSFPTPQAQLDEKDLPTIGLEFEEKIHDFSEGTFTFFKLPGTKFSFSSGNPNFLHHSNYREQSELDFFKRSENIIPGLGISEIIFPFHVFL